VRLNGRIDNLLSDYSQFVSPLLRRFAKREVAAPIKFAKCEYVAVEQKDIISKTSQFANLTLPCGPGVVSGDGSD